MAEGGSRHRYLRVLSEPPLGWQGCPVCEPVKIAPATTDGIGMSSVISFIRREPVAVASILAALVSEAVSLGIGQGEAGSIAATITVILGFIARSQVSPV